MLCLIVNVASVNHYEIKIVFSDLLTTTSANMTETTPSKPGENMTETTPPKPGENMTESTPPKPGENMLVITIEVVASVVGVLLAISVITIITLKRRKRNHDKQQDEYPFSDIPGDTEVFNSNSPTPFGGSSTSYLPESFPACENPTYVQSVSKGPDKRM